LVFRFLTFALGSGISFLLPFAAAFFPLPLAGFFSFSFSEVSSWLSSDEDCSICFSFLVFFLGASSLDSSSISILCFLDVDIFISLF